VRRSTKSTCIGVPSLVLAAILVIAACMLLLNGPISAQEVPGKLLFTVIVVDELVPKLVPFTDFRLTKHGEPPEERILRTDESGKITVELSAGEYDIATVKPVKYKGRSLSWSKTFKIEAGQECVLKLTDADASQSAAGRVSEEGQVYQNVKTGVVTVEADFGCGSGFIVDESGLVLTNSHVTDSTRWAAIRFKRGVRIPAVLVEEDKDADIAVLRFNPEAYKEFVVIGLVDPARGPVAVEGEKVLAIGSPLSQENIITTGIISKVEGDVLMSDVNINPGNSGGPLLNLDGQAVGLTTFGEGDARSGPGISGIVSISKALPVLERVRSKYSSLPRPSAEMLPDVSPVPIPLDALQEARLVERKLYKHKGPSKLDCFITTPFVDVSLEAAQERELAKGRASRTKGRGEKGVKEAYRFTHMRFYDLTDPVVTIVMKPELKETGKSKSGGFWAAVLGGLSGTYVHHKVELKFGDDFYDMQLYRGETLVQPVRRCRVPADILYNDFNVKVVDSAYGGVYRYDPMVFEPSQKLTIRTRRESNLDKWETIKFDKKTQQKIWEEFKAWRESVEQSQAGGS